MRGRQPARYVVFELVIIGEDGSYEGAVSASRQFDRLVNGVVRHYCGDWAKDFNLMNNSGSQRVFAAQQRWLNEAGISRIGIDWLKGLISAKDDAAFSFKLSKAIERPFLLSFVHQRPAFHSCISRIPDRNCRQSTRDGFADWDQVPSRHKDATNGCAFLPSFLSHLLHNFLHQEFEWLRAWRVCAENG
jgi:hypothetical protein